MGQAQGSSDRVQSPYDLVDLFCGCGGGSAGFLASGAFRHLYAADIDRWACATYSRNLGQRPDMVDLRNLATQPEHWASQLRRDGQGSMVLLGGPPCQGFSSHVKMKGDRHDRNTLVGTFATLAVALHPDVVVMENVPDLVSDRWWSVFCALRDELATAGYYVRARILNFAQLGVPQERFRLVLLASLAGRPTFPSIQRRTPAEFSIVKEWIGHLPPIESGQVDPADPMHEASRHRASTLEIIKQVPPDGGSRPANVGPACLQRAREAYGGYTDVYGRLAWSQTASTITARCRTPSCGRFVHPEQHRGLTAREAALLQTFPSDWIFEGPFDDRYKQIGNAVPPLGMRAFAEHIVAGFPSYEDEIGLFEVTDRPVGTSFSVLIPGIRRRGGTL
jgi:DNA (cytosine-5)-methyltransferase 1